jgi:DtxR family Mn-dependent transcriptional regulator
MTPGDRLLRGLAALGARVWGRDCPRGNPVPLEGPCADCDSVRLIELEEDEAVRVTCLEEPDSPAAVRLASSGVLPGTEVRLLQGWPAYVIGIGFAQLALDEESARHIRVRREGPPVP